MVVQGASSVLYRASYGHDQYQLYWEQELGEKPNANVQYRHTNTVYVLYIWRLDTGSK